MVIADGQGVGRLVLACRQGEDTIGHQGHEAASGREAVQRFQGNLRKPDGTTLLNETEGSWPAVPQDYLTRAAQTKRHMLTDLFQVRVLFGELNTFASKTSAHRL